MWKLTQDAHASGAFEVFEVEGVPVLVARAGRYPSAENHAGESTHKIAHILISIGGGADGDGEFFSGVSVSAVGARGAEPVRRVLPVFDEQHYGRKGANTHGTPDAWIAKGKEQVEEALSQLRVLDEKFEEAERFIARGYVWEVPLTRAAYEDACAQMSVASMADAEIASSYGVKHGHFAFPEYSSEYVVQMRLAFVRLKSIHAEQAQALKVAQAARASALQGASSPIKTGQLWEPCARCGTEPVFLPLHLCEQCWPAR